MKKKGVDLSGWNSVYNYSALAKAGCEFAILKVIKKNLNMDKLFETHFKGCNGAGIVVDGVYTYSYADTVAKAQQAIDACIKVINNVCAKYPQYERPEYIYLDLEDVVMRSLGHRIVDIIYEYKNRAEQAGYKFRIYTYQHFFNSYIKAYMNELSDIEFWIARYPSTQPITFTDEIPTVKFNIDADIVGWQYSSKGQVPGVFGFVDMNIWYKDEDFENTHNVEITAEFNPFAEPTTVIKLGSRGEGANWVLWYLWRFGLLLTDGVPDSNKICGYIDEEASKAIAESQERLGLIGKNVDARVGNITRALYKKVC